MFDTMIASALRDRNAKADAARDLRALQASLSVDPPRQGPRLCVDDVFARVRANLAADAARAS